MHILYNCTNWTNRISISVFESCSKDRNSDNLPKENLGFWAAKPLFLHRIHLETWSSSKRRQSKVYAGGKLLVNSHHHETSCGMNKLTCVTHWCPNIKSEYFPANPGQVVCYFDLEASPQCGSTFMPFIVLNFFLSFLHTVFHLSW